LAALAAGVVKLTEETGLIGLDQKVRLIKLNELGGIAAADLRDVLPRALVRFPHVLLLTHVPPLKEACWHDGSISSDHWLPHFSCQAFG
jgi:Icc protein